jgi:hypothetical protein
MSEQTTEPSKFLPSLKSATQSDTFFLLATFTLLIDSALIYIHGQGLIHHVQYPDEFKLAFALELYLLFVAFSFVMALIMPFIVPLTSQVVYWIWTIKESIGDAIRKIWRTRSDDAFPRRDTKHGCVSISDLKTKAFSTMEPYYLNLYKEQKQRQSKISKRKFDLRFMASAAFAAGFLNFTVSGRHSLLNNISQFLTVKFDGGQSLVSQRSHARLV